MTDTEVREYAKKENYQGKDNHQRPKVDYLNKIASMNDEELLSETENKIWMSAFANNNNRSDYHWHVDVCYDEWQHRKKPEQYEKAYNQARKSI